MKLSTLDPQMLDALCELVDNWRADGREWSGIVEDLAGRGMVLEVRGLELALAKWKRKQGAEVKRREKREVGVGDGEVFSFQSSVFSEVAVESFEQGEVGRGFSDEVRGVVKFLGKDLIGREPRWQYARSRRLRDGERYEVRRGAGSLQGREWLVGAVVIWQGEDVVEVLAEHKVRQVNQPRPPQYYRVTLELEIFTLVNQVGLKAVEQLLAVVEQMKSPMSQKQRLALERRKRRLEAKVAFTSGEGSVPVVRVQQIVSRLATVMHLYLPEETGIRSGAELARATGRTRAAVSAQKLTLVEEDTRATGGQAGFAHVTAAKRHRLTAGKEFEQKGTKDRKGGGEA